MPNPDESPTPTTPAPSPAPEQPAPPPPQAPDERPTEAVPAPADAPTPIPEPTPVEAYERYERIFEGAQAPFAFVDLDAVWSNAADMLRRAGGKQIRVATKSIRCRPMLERLIELDPGFDGLLTFSLAETLWLWEQGMRDLVCAYPTTDSACLTRLARVTAADPDEAPVVMVDCVEHLNLIESAAASFVAPVRVAIDIDLSWQPLRGIVKVGPKRSPIRRPEEAASLAREIDRRERVRLVGLMAYEGQIAGVGDHLPGKSVSNALTRAMQSASARDVETRRGEIVAAVMQVSELEFVNGGGTGSIELTAAEPAVTEVAAGSGFYAPVLFDHYRAFRLIPGAMFALPVVRKPSPGVATALGGGYPASGPSGRERMPVPHLPPGLRLDRFEGAGEAQTPLSGGPAAGLAVADRVYFRHAKAGELCERFNSLYLIAGSTIRAEVPTYRGEGKSFL
jgi:D-serine deaminase-like pyridoxal phosphate-dependent protein